MKNLLRVTLLLLVSFVLVSCAGEIAITLDTPQNVVITDGVLTWDAVTDATTYTVIVNSNSYTVSVTTFDLNTLDLPIGTYPVHIIAMQGTNLSEPSTTINFVIGAVVVGVPQNVAIADGIVTWSAVTGADSYVVHVGTETHTVTVTTFDLTTLTLEQGNYSVSVVAMIGTNASSSSTIVSYFVGGITLDVPQNVTITDGILTWSAVTGADSYVVYVDTDSYTVTVVTYDLTALDLAPGDHDVFVVAMAGTDLSESSLTVNYFIESADLSAIYANSLSLLNPSYEPDMVADDFEDEYEYQDYLDMSIMVLAYSTAVVEMGMTEVEALALFAHVASTPLRMETIDSITAMMAEIDSYDMFDMSSTDLATMLYELAVASVTIHIGDLEEKIVDYAAELTGFEVELATIQGGSDLTSVYTELSAYASPEELVQLTYFLSGQYEKTGEVLNALGQIVVDLRDNFEYHYPYYLDDGDEYIQMFYDIFTKVRIAENYTLLDSYMSLNPLWSLFNIMNIYEMIMYVNEDIDRRENELGTMTELLAFLITEKDLAIESATGVVDYLTLIYDTVPTSMVGLLDNFMANGELTMEEYFMLKDEVVNVLVTTLPSSADFAGIYTLLFTVADAFDVATVEDYLPYAAFLGEVDHATVDLALTLVGGIDQLTVEDVMAIVDGMVTPGECTYDEWYDEYTEQYYGEWYCDNDDVDFVKAIELAVYVGKYLDTFKLDNAAKFDTLAALSENDQIEELVNLFGNSVKEALLQQMDPDEYAMASMVIDEVLANYTEIMAAVDVVNAVGMDVVSEFLLNEGQMFLDLYVLINDGSGDLNDPFFMADVEAVLAQIVGYKAAMLNELDVTSIETLLNILRVPLKIELMLEEIEVTDFDATFDAMLVPISTMLDLVFTLMNEVDETVVVAVVGIANGMVTPGECTYDEYWDEWYCDNDDVDFEKAIELAVYVGTYLDTFKTANSAKFDAVSALFTDGQIETLLGLLAGIAKEQMALQMDPLDYEMAAMVIDEVLADYDNIIAAAQVVGSIGGNVIDEFLSTSGQLFLDLYDLANNGPGDLSDPLFVADVEALIVQVLNYNTAVMGELDITTIQTLLGLVRIPLMVQLSMESTLEPADVDTMFSVLLVPVSTVIVNIVALEEDFVAAIDGVDLSAVASWNLLGDDQSMALLVLALDDTLTTFNETLIFSIVTIVSDDILKNADVLLLNGSTVGDVDLMIGDIEIMLTDLFAEIHAVALFDFTATTQVEIDRLHALMDMLPMGGSEEPA